MNRRLALLLAAPLLAAGCSSSVYVDVPQDGREIARQGGGDDSVVWRLKAGGDDSEPRLIRDHHVSRRKVVLPLRAADIDKDRAARLGVEAWKGVYVERVEADSNLAKGGLQRGDVLLSIDGIELSGARQLREAVEPKLDAMTQLDLAVLRGGGEPPDWQKLSLRVDADSKVVHDTETASFKLATSKSAEQSTGLRLAELPAERARDVFGDDESRVLIADVVPGSPAYHAGLRGGDRIATVDRQPVATVSEIESAVAAALSNATGVELVVADAKGAEHSASLLPIERVGGRSSFTFPIVWCHERDIGRYEWTFLRFIFLFGAEYERQYVRTEARSAAAYTEFAMLPLGLFEIDTTPTRGEASVLWFIDWSWSR
jgi:membrane-associated protease RseP (regulator of RpoE activity)